MKQNYFFKVGLVLLFIFNISQSYGQDILTFDFSSLAGNEITASSNTNNSNLTTSTISRGAGLTASANSGRFNATNWSIGNIDTAITDEDYMEFTITPNPTFQFSVSSITVNVQRSGTGPGAITLRSSVDGYTNNLDSEKAITDNTSVQQFTFTFSQSDSTSPVTYRFYLHTAESTTGSGGFEGTGNDIIVNGIVSSASSSPTVGFETSSSSENETNSTFNTLIPVTFSNYSSNVTVSVTVNGSSTAEAGDYTLNSSSLTFTGNGTQNISLDINNDVDMDNETIILDLAVTSGTADLSISSHTVTIQDDDLPKIVISEIMYNTPSTDDEWIELYNANGSSVDVSNWTLEYNGNTFVFPGSTNLANNTYTVIAVGSNGDGTFNNDAPFTPDFNNLAVANNVVKDTNSSNKLGNTSGTITLKNASGNIVNQVIYTDSDQSSTDGNGSSFEIIDVTINNSATNNNWQASVANGGSPGKVSGSIWTGAIDSNWNTAGNWQVGIPTTISDVLIPNGLTNYPTINSAITVNSVTIESGASFIANAALTANVTYKRNLATNNWYLVSSPVAGETFENLISNHAFGAGTGSNIGLAPYANDGSVWNYQTATSTGSIASGQGISVKLNSAGDISFKGTVNTSNVTYPITLNTNNFNLIGNPFTSFVNLGTFFSDNSANLSEQTVWLWNQATNSYDTKMSGTDAAFQIAPGQGFFVSAGSNTNVTFNTANQSHQTDSFQRNSRTEVQLIATNNGISKNTVLYYIDGTTTGFDNGFDGSLFSGVANKYSLFTQLVSNNKGNNFAIQSLPLNGMETTVVPVGTQASSGATIEFSAKTMNLPTGIQVYLEDRVNNSFTNLSKENYTVTLKDDTKNIGQFYLHTSTKSLSNDHVTHSLENVSIYNSGKNELTITGLQATKASIAVYSILGQRVTKQDFYSNGVSTISIPSVTSGVYLIEVTTELGNINTKVIIK